MNPDQSPVDWPTLIGYLILVRRRQGEMIGGWRCEIAPPRAGAPERDIAAVEERFGPLEATHRSFLSHVNGWEQAAVDFSFLDTDALLDPRTDAGVVQYLTDCEVSPEVLRASAVVAISAVADQGDLLLLLAGRSGTAMAGQVLWCAPSGEIARYPGFAACFAALSEFEERVLERAGHPRVAPRPTYDDLRDLGGEDVGGQVAIARTLTADSAARWPVEVVVRSLAALKAALGQRGLGAVWGHPPAAGGASAAQIEAVGQFYGVSLQPRHARLLDVVDGWEHVMSSLDLLSTTQLRDPARMRPALVHARTVLDAHGQDLDDHLVLASSSESEDTLVISRTGGQVLWLRGADQVVATFPDLDHWLLHVIDAHLAELDATAATVRSPMP